MPSYTLKLKPGPPVQLERQALVGNLEQEGVRHHIQPRRLSVSLVVSRSVSDENARPPTAPTAQAARTTRSGRALTQCSTSRDNAAAETRLSKSKAGPFEIPEQYQLVLSDRAAAPKRQPPQKRVAAKEPKEPTAAAPAARPLCKRAAPAPVDPPECKYRHGWTDPKEKVKTAKELK